MHITKREFYLLIINIMSQVNFNNPVMQTLQETAISLSLSLSLYVFEDKLTKY